MKKFRLIVTIGDHVIYQALYQLTSEQYTATLETYTTWPHGFDPVQNEILEKVSGKVLPSEKDYLRECPDAIVAACIANHAARKLFSPDWCDFKVFKPKQASTVVEQTLLEQFSWDCVVVAD